MFFLCSKTFPVALVFLFLTKCVFAAVGYWVPLWCNKFVSLCFGPGVQPYTSGMPAFFDTIILPPVARSHPFLLLRSSGTMPGLFLWVRGITHSGKYCTSALFWWTLGNFRCLFIFHLRSGFSSAGWWAMAAPGCRLSVTNLQAKPSAIQRVGSTFSAPLFCICYLRVLCSNLTLCNGYSF